MNFDLHKGIELPKAKDPKILKQRYIYIAKYHNHEKNSEVHLPMQIKEKLERCHSYPYMLDALGFYSHAV